MRSHPGLKVTIAWLPRNCPFIGFRRARQLALEAIRTADLEAVMEPQTIQSQKARAKQQAIQTWTERWHQAPRTSFAYQTALTKPPDGRPHPTFKATQGRPSKRQTGDATPPNQIPKAAKFTRSTISTMYRVITGHAFTGAYTQRFYPDHSPEQIACPCGEPIQTIEHVLTVCPQYSEARCKHLTVGGRTRNISQMFNNPKRVQAVLRFLEETGACAKPRATWNPG
jgi:hypothetical protein